MGEEKATSKSKAEHERRIDLLIEEYKIGINVIHLLSQDSVKVSTYLIAFSSAILASISVLLQLETPPTIIIYNSSIEVIKIISILSIIILICGSLLVVCLRIWLFIHQRRVIEIEDLFHKDSAIGSDAGRIIDNCIRPTLSRKIALFAEGLIFIFFAIFLVAFVVILRGL